jgi:hypothetical protein
VATVEPRRVADSAMRWASIRPAKVSGVISIEREP